jgi:hypothetical protein
MHFKRGQTSQIFTWIFILIVAVSILLFGVKLIKQTKDLSEKASYEVKIEELKDSIEEVFFLDIGSSLNYQLNFPVDVEKVCFVFSDDNPTPIVPNNENLPGMINDLTDEFDYNFFIVGEEARFSRLEQIRNPDPLVSDEVGCFDNGDNIKIINKGRYVKIE